MFPEFCHIPRPVFVFYAKFSLKQAAVTGFFAGGFFALLLMGLWQEYSRLRSPAELPEPDASPVA